MRHQKANKPNMKVNWASYSWSPAPYRVIYLL